MTPKTLNPEHINQVACDLLISNSFLAACQNYPFMKGIAFPPFPLTHQKIDISDKSKLKVELNKFRTCLYKFADELSLVHQGVLFGWLYVCFVWLREADRGLFQRAINDRDFQSEWTPFLKNHLMTWTEALPRTMSNMMRHFRNAIAHGKIYINFEEAIASGESTCLTLSSKAGGGEGRVTAAFEASPKELFLFGEAVFRAHAAAAHGEHYRDVGCVPVLVTAKHEPV